MLKISDELDLGGVNKVNQFSKTQLNKLEQEKQFFNNLYDKSFNADKDFVSDIIKINNSSFYLYNVSNIYSPSPIKIENIEKTVEKDLRFYLKKEEISKLLDLNKYKENFIEEQSFFYNIDFEKIDIRKGSNILPLKLTNAIFNENEKSNLFDLDTNELNFIKIDEIIIKENSNFDNELSILGNLKNSFSNELLKNLKVSTNDNLINAVLDNY